MSNFRGTYAFFSTTPHFTFITILHNGQLSLHPITSTSPLLRPANPLHRCQAQATIKTTNPAITYVIGAASKQQRVDVWG